MEKGDLYGIPFAFVLTSLFYNKTMFDSYGMAYPNNNWSWFTARDNAKKLSVDLNGDGKKDQWGLFSDRSYTTLDPIIHAFGGIVLDDNFNVTIDQPKSIEAIQFMVDLIHKDGVSPVPGSGINLFRDGKMGMLIENVSQLSGFRTGSKFDWDVALMPSGPAKRVVRLWPDSFAIASTSKNKEAAWEYIKFVITQKKMDRYSGSRKIPVYKQLATSREWLEESQMPNKKVFIESIQYGDPLEFRPKWGDWDGAKGNALMPAWKGEQTVQQAVANAAQALRNIINAPAK
jgi:multiple sugar transport system substrate-binding protein